MLIEGTITRVLPLQSGISKTTGKEWKKAGYVLQTNEQYPKDVMFTLFGDKADQYPLQVGNQVQVSFDIESREYNGRWYTDVSAYKVDNLGQQTENDHTDMDAVAEKYFDDQPTPQQANPLTPQADDLLPF